MCVCVCVFMIIIHAELLWYNEASWGTSTVLNLCCPSSSIKHTHKCMQARLWTHKHTQIRQVSNLPVHVNTNTQALIPSLMLTLGLYSARSGLVLIHFTLWCTVACSCAPALLTSWPYSFLPSPYQVHWAISYGPKLNCITQGALCDAHPFLPAGFSL